MARQAQRRASAWELAGAAWAHPLSGRARGLFAAGFGVAMILALASYNAVDPSFNAASAEPPKNLLGGFGAGLADMALQSLGLAAWLAAVLLLASGFGRVIEAPLHAAADRRRMRAGAGLVGALALSGLLAWPVPPAAWPLAKGLGGFWGDGLLHLTSSPFAMMGLPAPAIFAAGVLAVTATFSLVFALGVKASDFAAAGAWLAEAMRPRARVVMPERSDIQPEVRRRAAARRPPLDLPDPAIPDAAEKAPPQVLGVKAPKPSTREMRENQKTLPFAPNDGYVLPELAMLAKPKARAAQVDEESIRQNARLLESVLAEFGVNGKIDQIRPGPVVTLYEFVPAPGVKTARVVALSDDIARSMSVASCRVSVASGRNAIGVELPNARRETVYLRDLLASTDFEKTNHVLPLALGESINGEPYIADLARMPHLLIAGTTGSGKSVGVNAMILSILYRFRPDQCRLIMIDPKMLELSVYDGIPHLLAPVVTDPKKAIVALKWTVREMEDRYRLMSKIGVRNVAGYNERAAELAAKGEHFVRTVQTGFDERGRPIYEEERLD
ncbi:MAG: DNA translocase FtsK 4TM domain-containing protein, partial [Caulobacteraceae bacterium]